MKIEVIWRRVPRVGVRGDIRDIDHRSAKTLIKLGAARAVDGSEPRSAPKSAKSTPAAAKRTETAETCNGVKLDGDPCRAKAQGDTGYCHAHQSQARTYKRRDIEPANKVVAKPEGLD